MPDNRAAGFSALPSRPRASRRGVRDGQPSESVRRVQHNARGVIALRRLASDIIARGLPYRIGRWTLEKMLKISLPG